MIGETIETIPDLAEPIRAYRVWGVTRIEGGPVLVSLGGRSIWPTQPPLVAVCTNSSLRDHPVPSETDAGHNGKGCGVYAFKTLADCAWEFELDGASQIWGEVLLWGTVYEHDKGYRAQYAQVLRLFDLGTRPKSPDPSRSGELITQQDMEGLATAYGVPVEPFPEEPLEILRFNYERSCVELKELEDKLMVAARDLEQKWNNLAKTTRRTAAAFTGLGGVLLGASLAGVVVASWFRLYLVAFLCGVLVALALRLMIPSIRNLRFIRQLVKEPPNG